MWLRMRLRLKLRNSKTRFYAGFTCMREVRGKIEHQDWVLFISIVGMYIWGCTNVLLTFCNFGGGKELFF